MPSDQRKRVGIAFGFLVLMGIFLVVAIIGSQQINEYRSKAYTTCTGPGETVCGGVCCSAGAYCVAPGSNRCSNDPKPPPNTPGPCDPNSWGGWSACSVACGGGTQTRANACGTVQSQACNTQACLIPTSTPILPTPTPTPPSCTITKGKGDANCDGVIDGIDYSIWLNSQCSPGANQKCADYRADFDGNGKVDDNDYQIWFSHRGT